MRKPKTYRTRAEALKQVQQAYQVACDILGSGNVKFDTDIPNRRFLLITPEIDGTTSIQEYLWEME